VAIGRVNVANGRLSFCTGTLVAPRTVVTAAHCLWVGHTDRWVKPDDVHSLSEKFPDLDIWVIRLRRAL
jgi:protease YdgD